jgi:hypothetical protein
MEDTLGLEVELDLETTPATVYYPGRSMVDSDIVVVELPTAAVRRDRTRSQVVSPHGEL